MNLGCFCQAGSSSRPHKATGTPDSGMAYVPLCENTIGSPNSCRSVETISSISYRGLQ